MEFKNNNKQNLPPEVEELIRSYRVPVRSSKEEVLGKLLGSIDEKEAMVKVPRRKITWYMAAASVAATIAIVVSVWLFTATETLSSAQGYTSAFRLPDQSRVVLHDGSSLSFRKYMWNRRVRLEGEAYFEVEKGTGFKVLTPNGEVEVLGTRFLVKDIDESFAVQCYQGKVRAGYAHEAWILDPGTEVRASGEGAGKKEFASQNGYPTFARFTASYNNAPVSEVMKDVEQFFGVDIIIDAPAGKRFSGTVETGSLENVLRIVSEPLQLNYAFEDKYRIRILN